MDKALILALFSEAAALDRRLSQLLEVAQRGHGGRQARDGLLRARTGARRTASALGSLMGVDYKAASAPPDTSSLVA